jgi:hypothetical protein
VTVASGSNASLLCGYPSGSSAMIMWSMSSPTTRWIFLYPPATFNSSLAKEYAINGTFNLVIIEASPSSDAGTYTCFFQPMGNNFANLVVIGKIPIVYDWFARLAFIN